MSNNTEKEANGIKTRFEIPIEGIFGAKFEIIPITENNNIKKELNQVIFQIFFRVRNLFFVASGKYSIQFLHKIPTLHFVHIDL